MPDMPIKVYFPTNPYDLHYVYQEAYENPPEGIEYVCAPRATSEDTSGSSGVNSSISTLTAAIRRHSDLLTGLYNRYWKWSDVSKIGVSVPEHDIYHNRSTPRQRDEMWVQECEHVGNILGNDFREHFEHEPTLRRIQQVFADDNCRAIMAHTHAAAESVRATIPNPETFEDKLHRVPLAYDPPSEAEIAYPGDGEKTRFLFIGSKFFDAQFYIKGGDKVLRAYDQIRDQIDAELVVRADVPDQFVAKYGHYDDITLLTDVIPRDELNEILSRSDVFVFPSAQGTPGMVFREAMGYGMSIIGLDIWGNDELVENGDTGFLVEPDPSVQYLYDEYNVPIIGAGTYFKDGHGDRTLEEIVDELTADDDALVDRIADRMRLLAEDDDMRDQYGCAGRRKITTGPLSLEGRNEKLAHIYQNAVSN